MMSGCRNVLAGKGHCGSWGFAQIFTALHEFCITDQNAVLDVKAEMNKTEKPHGVHVLCCVVFFFFNLHSVS